MKHLDDNIAVCRPPREIRREILQLVAVFFGLFGATEAIAVDPISTPFLTGPKFRQAIEQPLSGSWTNIEFRLLLKDIANQRKISIVLDRRLNPSVELPIDVTNVPLRVGLTGIARQADGDASVLENGIFLGPKSATRTLRTLIELRTADLQSKESGISKKRRSDLREQRTFHWDDLEAPREILGKIAGHVRLKISNPELVPHDLWAETTLPQFTVPEALSVILTQFDLTYRWIDDGTTIELVPVPDTVSIERKYRSKQKPSDAIAAIHRHFPRVVAEISNVEIVVNGLSEDHEAISHFLRGDGVNAPVKIDAPRPIRERVFLLKAERVPVIELMKKLEESAITFEFDANELQAARIDLEKTINVDVKNVSSAEFFKAVFDPIGLDFEIDHLSVRLKPKQKN